MRNSRFIEYFKNFAKLDLLTFTNPSAETDIDYIKETFEKHYHFNSYANKYSILEKLIYLLPWQLTKYYSRETQKEINRIIENNQYDFIFVSKLESLLYFLRLPKKWHSRIIMDFDDILSDLYRKHYTDFFASFKNSFFLRFNESRALKYFKRIFICSNEALLKINKKYYHKAAIIPNIYPYSESGLLSPSTDKSQLLYVGSLDYFPNTEGLKWFFDIIWPKAKQAYPDLKLTVIGKTHKGLTYIYSLLGIPKDVEIVLNVPSTVPYYENAFATIVPLLNGSGTRLKILESVAFGRPVITTLKGAEGLEFEGNKHMLFFKNANCFIDSYNKLLDTQVYNNIVNESLRVLKGSYSQDVFKKSMDESWRTITEDSSRLNIKGSI
jgi:glycosyltransferase involved in cell wall biosynthesis